MDIQTKRVAVKDLRDPAFFEAEKSTDPVPFWKQKGELLVQTLWSWIRAAEDPKIRPPEASRLIPPSLLAINGVAFGTLPSNNATMSLATLHVEGADRQNSIINESFADGSLEYVIHDEMLAHLMGTDMTPYVEATRSKFDMAMTLQELAEARWTVHENRKVFEQALTNARLRGTTAVEIYRDPHTCLARTRVIPTIKLVLDPTSGSSLIDTKWRAAWKEIPRTKLRQLMQESGLDPKLADFAGAPQDRMMPEYVESAKLTELEYRNIRVLDFFYDDHEGYRRHVVLAEGVPIPIRDEPQWSYDLPPRRWPICVFRLNTYQDVSPWGACDFRFTQEWQQFHSWAMRYISVAAGQAAKVSLAYDQALGDPYQIKKVVGNLRKPYESMPLNIRNMLNAGVRPQDLIFFLDVPTKLDELLGAEDKSRLWTSYVSLLEDMNKTNDNPFNVPARLDKRRSDWRKYIEEILTIESIVDMTFKPVHSIITIQKHAKAIQETDTPADLLPRAFSMELKEAKRLEANLVPSAWARGQTGEEYSPQALSERELRKAMLLGKNDSDLERKLVRGSEHKPLKLQDYAVVRIIEPGIAQYAKRRVGLTSWEGAGRTTFNPAQDSLHEFKFYVDVIYPGQGSEQAIQQSMATAAYLEEHMTKFGLHEAIMGWQQEYDQAVKQGNPPPPAPIFLQHLVRSVNKILRSTDSKFISLHPYDYATTMKYGMMQQQMMMQQQAAAAQAEQGAGDEQFKIMELQLREKELAMKEEIHKLKLAQEQIRIQTELARQQAQLANTQYKMMADQLAAAREVQEAPFKAVREEQRAQSGAIKTMQEEAELKRIAAEIERTQAQTAMTVQQMAERERLKKEQQQRPNRGK